MVIGFFIELCQFIQSSNEMRTKGSRITVLIDSLLNDSKMIIANVDYVPIFIEAGKTSEKINFSPSIEITYQKIVFDVID